MRSIIIGLAIGLLACGWWGCTPVTKSDNSDKRLLLLLRHSKDSKKDKYKDFERPLTKKGKKDARAIGVYLQEQGIRPDCIVSSTARRAVVTAELVARELGYSPESVTLDSTLYKCRARVLIERIRMLDDSCKQVLVVGHNPATIQAANHFQRDTVFMAVPKSALIGIEFDNDRSWSVLGHKEGRFSFFTKG